MQDEKYLQVSLSESETTCTVFSKVSIDVDPNTMLIFVPFGLFIYAKLRIQNNGKLSIGHFGTSFAHKKTIECTFLKLSHAHKTM